MIDELENIDFSLLKKSKRGIERETLRITNDGNIAQTKHPRALGEKLTHGSITVDFSEELLEVITPPCPSNEESLKYLTDVSSFTLKNLDSNELIWAASMPPTSTEDEIHIANFGLNNSAKMKEIYRHGLANRYNKIMQIISGIHYNYSPAEEFLKNLPCCHKDTLTDRKNNLYFRLINKFHRSSWALTYLFGSSPFCAKTSVHSKPDYLSEFDSKDYIGEYSTSLRMSDLGYQSDAQESLFVSCKNINTYVVDLLKATYTPYGKYQKMGIKNPNGEYLQLNESILQIENEYYSTIRPKQITRMGERPACALLRRGVEYVEVRLLDIDPFSAIGISEETGYFIEVFLISCMLNNREYYTDEAMHEAKKNFNLVSKYGRKPNLELMRRNKTILLQDWLHIILNSCLSIAEKMDIGYSDKRYSKAVNLQFDKLNDVNKTPAAKLVTEIKNSGLAYQEWMLNQSIQHSNTLRNHVLDKSILKQFSRDVKNSRKQWLHLEKHRKDEGSLEDYISLYYSNIC